MTKEQAQTLKPWDVVVFKDKGNKPSYRDTDVLVKRVVENGVFCLPRIQSTAVLYRFEDLEFQ